MKGKFSHRRPSASGERPFFFFFVGIRSLAAAAGRDHSIRLLHVIVSSRVLLTSVLEVLVQPVDPRAPGRLVAAVAEVDEGALNLGVVGHRAVPDACEENGEKQNKH